ncbi:NAC domain-containing protein [Drosera capensis]
MTRQTSTTSTAAVAAISSAPPPEPIQDPDLHELIIKHPSSFYVRQLSTRKGRVFVEVFTMGLVDNMRMPGFRFHPTDEELVMYYLKRKVMGKKLCAELISELDIYKFEPSDLPDKACFKSRDLNWYFFCPRGNKYGSGVRANRATEFGYWKATGNDRPVLHNHRTVGKIKTLIFHRGKAPKGDRTDWVLHEYRLEDDTLSAAGVIQDSFVICKVFHKSGLGPRNGEDYGAPFNEEEWEGDDDDVEYESTLPPAKCGFDNNASAAAAGQCGIAGNVIYSTMTSSEIVTGVDPVNNHPVALYSGGLGQPSSCPTPIVGDELDKLLAMFVGSPDLTTNEEAASVDLLPAEAAPGVYDQLEDLFDFKRIDGGQYLPSPWENYHLDNHLYLQMDDLDQESQVPKL